MGLYAQGGSMPAVGNIEFVMEESVRDPAIMDTDNC